MPSVAESSTSITGFERADDFVGGGRLGRAEFEAGDDRVQQARPKGNIDSLGCARLLEINGDLRCRKSDIKRSISDCVEDCMADGGPACTGSSITETSLGQVDERSIAKELVYVKSGTGTAKLICASDLSSGIALSNVESGIGTSSSAQAALNTSKTESDHAKLRGNRGEPR